MSEKKKNILSPCMECWRKNPTGLPPVLYMSLLTSLMCWIIGSTTMLLLLGGTALVMFILQHMKDTPEE